MLLGNFFRVVTVQKKEENTWKVSIEFNPHHPVYKENFPDESFIPGVCLMQMIRECVSDLLSKTMYYQTVSGFKLFMNIDPEKIPGMDFCLCLQRKEDNHYLLIAEGFVGDERAITLRGILA